MTKLMDTSGEEVNGKPTASSNVSVTRISQKTGQERSWFEMYTSAVPLLVTSHVKASSGSLTFRTVVEYIHDSPTVVLEAALLGPGRVHYFNLFGLKKAKGKLLSFVVVYRVTLFSAYSTVKKKLTVF